LNERLFFPIIDSGADPEGFAPFLLKLMETTAIAKILLIFSGVLVSSRAKVPLGIGLLGGGLGLEIWAGKETTALLTDLSHALFRPELWLLVLNITLILEFGYFMAEESNSNAIIQAAQRLGGRHGRVFSLILIPAAIGLVPMPGGALFSAPMVGQAVVEDNWAPAWKAAVNYWFRHILEYWWPLYRSSLRSPSSRSMPGNSWRRRYRLP